MSTPCAIDVTVRWVGRTLSELCDSKASSRMVADAGVNAPRAFLLICRLNQQNITRTSPTHVNARMSCESYWRA